jgi:hypothetical protein
MERRAIVSGSLGFKPAAKLPFGYALIFKGAQGPPFDYAFVFKGAQGPPFGYAFIFKGAPRGTLLTVQGPCLV